MLTQRPVRANGVATDRNSRFLRAPETGCRQCLLDCFFSYFTEQQRNRKNTKGHFKERYLRTLKLLLLYSRASVMNEGKEQWWNDTDR